MYMNMAGYMYIKNRRDDILFNVDQMTVYIIETPYSMDKTIYSRMMR